MAYDEVGGRSTARSPGPGGRSEVHHPTPGAPLGRSDPLGKFGDLEGPPRCAQLLGHRGLSRTGGTGERHRRHAVPVEGTEQMSPPPGRAFHPSVRCSGRAVIRPVVPHTPAANRSTRIEAAADDRQNGSFDLTPLATLERRRPRAEGWCRL